MATLIITTGPRAGDHYPLGHRTNVIGRDEGLLIQLLDQHVSRKHVQVRYDKEKDQHVASDMDSRHGTFVNGNRIHEDVPLKDNDTIDVGGVTLLFTTQDFPDKESALAHFRKVGERYRGTLME
jgi:pSer/pThr/pTyr-binding forkhead associated (FHA) protein